MWRGFRHSRLALFIIREDVAEGCLALTILLDLGAGKHLMDSLDGLRLPGVRKSGCFVSIDWCSLLGWLLSEIILPKINKLLFEDSDFHLQIAFVIGCEFTHHFIKLFQFVMENLSKIAVSLHTALIG